MKDLRDYSLHFFKSATTDRISWEVKKNGKLLAMSESKSLERAIKDARAEVVKLRKEFPGWD